MPTEDFGWVFFIIPYNRSSGKPPKTNEVGAGTNRLTRSHSPTWTDFGKSSTSPALDLKYQEKCENF